MIANTSPNSSANNLTFSPILMDEEMTGQEAPMKYPIQLPMTTDELYSLLTMAIAKNAAAAPMLTGASILAAAAVDAAVDRAGSTDQQYISQLEDCCAMLARRCAGQARCIADLLATHKDETPHDPDPIHAAIAVHQRAGQR